MTSGEIQPSKTSEKEKQEEMEKVVDERPHQMKEPSLPRSEVYVYNDSISLIL